VRTHKCSYFTLQENNKKERFRPLSDKTHGGLRLVSGTQPVEARTRTLVALTSEPHVDVALSHSDGGILFYKKVSKVIPVTGRGGP
jgi:hypothetical protein